MKRSPAGAYGGGLNPVGRRFACTRRVPRSLGSLLRQPQARCRSDVRKQTAPAVPRLAALSAFKPCPSEARQRPANAQARLNDLPSAFTLFGNIRFLPRITLGTLQAVMRDHRRTPSRCIRWSPISRPAPLSSRQITRGSLRSTRKHPRLIHARHSRKTWTDGPRIARLADWPASPASCGGAGARHD